MAPMKTKISSDSKAYWLNLTCLPPRGTSSYDV